MANENGWGGRRAGAGRPKGTTKDESHIRPQHQVRAYADEWEVIKEFTRLVKLHGVEKAHKALEAMES